MWSLNKSRRCFLGGRKSRPPADLLMLGDIRRDIIYIDWIHVRRDRKDIMLMKMAEGTSYQNPVVWTFKKASGTARLMTDHKPLLHAPPCWLSFDHLQDQWGTEEKKTSKDWEKKKKHASQWLFSCDHSRPWGQWESLVQLSDQAAMPGLIRDPHCCTNNELI